MVDLASVSSTAVNILVMIISIALAGGTAIAITFLVLKWKQYNEFDCFIFSKDGFGQLAAKKDKGGIFVDKKTKNKRLFLKNNDVGLNPDNIPYVMMGNKKIIFLLQTGLKNFQYINLSIDTNKVSVNVGEEDVNWAINSYERAKKLFSTSMLLQYMPYIALFFVSIIIVIIFIYFFKEFSHLKELAEALRDAMQYAAQAKAGTTILP